MFFFFNDTATTEIYTLSLHDALPISGLSEGATPAPEHLKGSLLGPHAHTVPLDSLGQTLDHRSRSWRSEEHTSELQSRQYLVCRLLLEKKKDTQLTIAPVPTLARQ